MVTTREGFPIQLRVEAVDFGHTKCSYELHVWAKMTDILQWSARYTTSIMTAETCQDIKMYCKHLNMRGRIVRALCSETCGCSTFDSSILGMSNSGCKPICKVERQAKLDRE